MDIELPDGIVAVESPLPGLSIDTPTAKGTICFNGGQVLSWQPAGHEPVLWSSMHSRFAPGSPIRGGIPLVWPYFGNGAEATRTPQHGFARTSQWSLRDATVTPGGTATITLCLNTSSVPTETRGDLPDDVELMLQVVMDATLQVQLIVQAGASEITFEEGLHTYFAVGDITKTSITGLDQSAYEDRLDGRCHTQHGNVTFTAQTDRIHDSAEPVCIVDETTGRTIQVTKVGSAQTVVWNPWIEKSQAMTDFGDDEWRKMVCVEAVNVRDRTVRLAAGKRHLMSQTIEVI